MLTSLQDATERNRLIAFRGSQLKSEEIGVVTRVYREKQCTRAMNRRFKTNNTRSKDQGSDSCVTAVWLVPVAETIAPKSAHWFHPQSSGRMNLATSIDKPIHTKTPGPASQRHCDMTRLKTWTFKPIAASISNGGMKMVSSR